ncbi:MAG: ABC transporter ATP-binding protein [Deltaproteobacteria bacterium]|jgi:putative ABC transport system ATP-binding protein|nr:ABC transporter ATP-binding protein [Deltaproteobacteria bacterium]
MVIENPSQDYAVNLKNLLFHWPGQAPLLNIESLAIAKGESLFIAGHSGSGKSTLLNLIGGLIAPVKGEIWVEGVNLKALSGPARDRFRGDRVGFIFQSFNLLPYLSAQDNVALPAKLSAYRRDRAKEAFGSVAAAVESLMTSLDLSPDLWTRPAFRLSVGQRQRVAAARALLGRPPLIMADEPTSSLDADRRGAFVDLLLKESQKAGASVLFVSHEVALADRFGAYLTMESLRPSPKEEA